ncbi:hypothetical protein [Streptomyces sp. NBC_01538]|uniref:hypothetical protein n=1 Tax=Streptomyces sp. NBC_01538 TaxID=2903897 RepID=UPI00386EA34B
MAGAEPGLGALFITLPGPLTNASKASAADGNPTFRIGTDGQEAYGRFLDAVANRAASGSSAEAARFRPIGTDIGMVMGGGELRLPADFVAQENLWDNLSVRSLPRRSSRRGSGVHRIPVRRLTLPSVW